MTLVRKDILCPNCTSLLKIKDYRNILRYGSADKNLDSRRAPNGEYNAFNLTTCTLNFHSTSSFFRKILFKNFATPSLSFESMIPVAISFNSFTAFFTA